MSRTTEVIYSKLLKNNIMARDRELSGHLPSSRRFNRSNLTDMLRRFGMVYVKPDIGSLGIGVMRVERGKSGYKYQRGMAKHSFLRFEELYRSLRNEIGSQKYLIQKGIHVLRHEGRPFDFRVMVQKDSSGKWTCTGTAGRVAHPSKAVTNGSQGGTIYPADALISSKTDESRMTDLLRTMERLAERTGARFSRGYPAMKELGLDIAVDRNLKPWILEVNTRPDPCPFTKLPDKKMIDTIVAYARAYGRRYCLNCTKAKKAPGSGG